MKSSEIQQLKEVIESNSISNLLSSHVVCKEKTLTYILNFLTFTKEYSALSNLKKEWEPEELLPIYAIAEQECCNVLDATAICYKRFLKDGYFYHVTSTENLDSILEKGIVSLNRRFQGNLYTDCLEINRCWKEIIRKQESTSLEDLIYIPNFDTLYQERFDSIYFGANLNELLTCYGHNSELVHNFVEKLLERCFCYVPLSRFTKQELREFLIENLNYNFDIEDNEMDCLMRFYDQYYKEENATRYGLENKTILMIPQNKVQDCTDESYISLMQNPDDFITNYLTSYDIEYKGDLSPKGLVAISIDNNFKIKVKSGGKGK